jgi:hypothetical protein
METWCKIIQHMILTIKNNQVILAVLMIKEDGESLYDTDSWS